MPSDHETLLVKTWQMIERCASSINNRTGHWVQLDPACCAALLAEKRSEPKLPAVRAFVCKDRCERAVKIVAETMSSKNHLGRYELEVGLSPDELEVVVNHPEMTPNPGGEGGHIVFSPQQARDFAALLVKKAGECVGDRS